MTRSSRSLVRRLVISMAATLSVATTSSALAQGPTLAKSKHAVTASSGERPFLFDNKLAMNKMSRRMMINPTGDVDRDFVAMMIPHHQGAIDMARAEIRYGHDEALRHLSKDIINQQAQEISVMRHAIDGDSRGRPPNRKVGLLHSDEAGRSSAVELHRARIKVR